MVRADHPANSTRGGVCMFYKICLPLKVLDIRFLHESIAFELQIGDELCSFISPYRSSNQSYDDFVSFLDNFELTLDTPAHRYLKTMNILQIPRKKWNYSIHFLRTSAP